MNRKIMVITLRAPGSLLYFKYLHVMRADNMSLSYYLKSGSGMDYSLSNLQLKTPLPTYDYHQKSPSLAERIITSIITGVYNYYDHECEPEPVKGWRPASHWDDHPDYPASDWMREVGEGDTRLGYVDWVNAEIEVRKNG